eukprot:TRINITY_DN36256_c0_g1_i1.p1 TRINITY_DN36256_c0_g1~~TRINITY_DN36256_c0_g1_i1.p1  ORF type:complete len:2648 (-),score=427.06 TRINITY_DN36256_c0_g1_i1:64-8007(-)
MTEMSSQLACSGALLQGLLRQAVFAAAFLAVARLIAAQEAEGGEDAGGTFGEAPRITGPPLEILSVARSERRILQNDEVLEYMELDLHFSAPVYVKSCSGADTVHVAEAKRCTSCPPGCVLSALFSRFPYVPDLLPKLQSEPECICGVSYEEIQLRVQAWPGDQGFNVLTDRKPARIIGVPDIQEAYGSAIWKFDALMAELECPNEANMTPALARVRRFGLNGPPLDESLLWLRRAETAFGVEEIDRMINNASRSYDNRRAVFLLPVRRTRNGRTRQIGLSPDELAECKINFPFLVGPHGQPAQSIDKVGDVAVKRLACKTGSMETVHRQMRAVMNKVLTAGQQTGHCMSDWRTSFPARGGGGPGGTAGGEYSWGVDMSGVNETYSPYTQQKDTRRQKRVGSLAIRHDFEVPTPEHRMPCSVLRWQLRLRAHNTRERAMAYTAADAVNGCWELMERNLRFETRKVVQESRSCQLDPEDTEFYFDPCCNMQKLRWQCCTKKNSSMELPVLTDVDQEAMAEICRVDMTGAASFVRAALLAAQTWRRRLSEASGTMRSWMNLAVEEQANAALWRTIEQCHADVMGRFDRELGFYVGAPCFVDGDCWTECRKPALSSLHMKMSLKANSKHKPLVIGRCTVPTQSRHVYIVQCLARRTGKEVVELMGAQLGVDVRQRNEQRIIEVLPRVPSRMTEICVGPQATPGVIITREECLSYVGCNWHHEIASERECIGRNDDIADNDFFCGCVEGMCPQQSLRKGCVSGDIFTAHCAEARQLLLPVELGCKIIATTPSELLRCKKFSQAHSLMLRNCLESPCQPRGAGSSFMGGGDQGGGSNSDGESASFKFYADEMCHDNIRREFGGCYDKCIMPSGPNPTIEKKVCFYELWPNETDQDCYLKPGDTEVQYSPPAGGENEKENWARGLTVQVPQTRKPRYCTIRVWQELQQSSRPRSLALEKAQVFYDVDKQEADKAMEVRRTEGTTRRDKMELAQNPPKYTGCQMGPLELTAENTGECRLKENLNCCLSPENLTLGFCKVCIEANTTACSVGERVFAVWAPNMRVYPATLVEDLGSDLARVDWDDGEIYYRQMPWPWLWSTKGPGCHPAAQGCGSHAQCPNGQYCFGCEECAQAHGGNPPPGLCDPCPTHRGGGCGTIDTCTRLQDSIDGVCPVVEQVTCPCKEEWSVRYQYPGAPTEESINECYYDKTQHKRWCEVDEKYYGVGCDVQRIVGVDRFIFWQPCLPTSCDNCHCDCSKKCKAYDVIPYEGRLPTSVIPGNLSAPLDQGVISFIGIIAPNCTLGSAARIRNQCKYCVACCADYCHDKTKQEGGFDCTMTEVSGCADSLKGWSDSVGRSCADYAQNGLCTHGGLYGTNWLYNPPRSFQDFAISGLAATDTCCDCGGGVDCSDVPFDWVDPAGNNCDAYALKKWCNRTGYGPGWDLRWGPFQLGKNGVDAHTACCFCGGGEGLRLPEVKNHLVADETTCLAVWPGRSRWAFPPWHEKAIHLCRLVSNVCMRKVQATAYDPALGYSVPDDPRIYGLCLQRAYDTGTTPYLEDYEITLAPPGLGDRRLADISNITGGIDNETIARRLAPLDRNLKMIPTELTDELFKAATAVRVDFLGNNGQGMCYYRMPDPQELFGGPNRRIFPPPLLPERTTPTDVFELPNLQALGWPKDFWGALFEHGDPERAINATLEDAALISRVLRALLATKDVELVMHDSQWNVRKNHWLNLVQNQFCKGPVDDLVKFRQGLRWSPATLNDEKSCIIERCDVDEMIFDDWTCKLTMGCSAFCPFCSSPGLLTQDQGMCVSTNKADLRNCAPQGGILIKDIMFNEVFGVNMYMEVCAMPHRPVMHCMGPGFLVKRCANFDEEHCEGDPVGDLMSCQLNVRPCQTEKECRLSGYCSDTDIGLSRAVSGTCIITPMDDDLVQRGCTSDGLCYFRVDPAFGMEARHRHGLLDLSEHDADIQGTRLQDAEAFATSIKEAKLVSETTDFEQIRSRLRNAGRLNKSECENLNPMSPPFKAIWVERAVTPQACNRWKSCCLLQRGDRCELFTGQVVDTDKDAELAKERQAECELCGGTWSAVFRWTSGEWRRGDLKTPGRAWKKRAWGSINEWAPVVDIDVLRKVFENALEARIGQQRLNAALGIVEPLMASLKSVAAACGSEAAALDTAVQKTEESEGTVAAPPASQLPGYSFPLGKILATSGLISSGFIGDVSISWHEFSTQKYGASDVAAVEYEVSIEPLESVLGVAAPQIALPGRADLVRQYLSSFLVAEDTTTTLSPATMDTLDSAGIRGGYPAWIVNEMMNLGVDPSIEVEKAAALAASAQNREKLREQARIAQAKEADQSSDLPQASQDVVTGDINTNISAIPIVPDDMLDSGTIDLSSFQCRNVIANNHGEVIGQLLGDCVHLRSSQPLENAVELCMPLTFGTHQDIEAFNATEQGQSFGITFDFALKTRVPDTYSVDQPPPLDAGTQVPGRLGQVMWLWEDNPLHGRLPPGWAQLEPLNLPAELRKDGSGISRLCSQVFVSEMTYCPVVRLDTDFFKVLWTNSSGKPKVLGLDSGCPEWDRVLQNIHNTQAKTRTDVKPYQPTDQQVSDPEVLAERSTKGQQKDLKPSSSVPICLPGSCLVSRGRGFQVMTMEKADGRCVIQC